MNKIEKTPRSWSTSITAVIIGVVILGVSLLLLPISTIPGGLTFGTGILLVILCVLVALEGKKGTIKELIYSLTFWR